MLFWSIIMVFVCIFVLNIIRIIICDRWLKTERKKYLQIKDCIYSKTPLFILIPVLNEQKIVGETYTHFKKIIAKYENVVLVFITTEKETNAENRTFDIIEELISKNNDQKKVWLINYPYKKGVMAHQLNYAIKMLYDKVGTIKFWIGVYNADSRINESVIDYVIDNIEHSKDNDRVCFQQYSWYYTSGSNQAGLLASAALWQTRWSITFEISRVYLQLFLLKAKIPKSIMLFIEKMNYVIGHGFFINADVLDSVGGFPENTINEDAYLGYLLNCADVQIKPIPILEIAESPHKLRIYINQQETWFNGPCYAFQYYKYLRYSLKKKFLLREFLLAIKLFCHAIYWIIAPITLLVICPIMIRSYFELIAWVLLILLHLPFTHFIINKFIISHTHEVSLRVPKASLWCILFYLIHCLGPIKNIIKRIRGINTIDNKYKTER